MHCYEGPRKSEGTGIAWNLTFWSVLIINLLGDNINTMKRNTQTLLDTNMEVGQETCR
jgi:hypothetical protein